MKFLVDAHLPPGLCAVLQHSGHDAVHTHQLELDRKSVRVVL